MTLYVPQDWVLVRAPRLPIDDYLRGGGRPTGDPDHDGAARLAVAVASPSLLGAADRPDDAKRAARKLMRYRIRMSTRPTPFGMFAGVALARYADRTDLALASEPVRTRTRPDMAWLFRQVLAAEAEPDGRRAARVVANSGVFERAGRLWLAERASMSGDGPEPPVSVRATRPARLALAEARRPVLWTELAAALVDATGAPPEKVEGLLDELWRQTFLLTDLRPPLTTGDPGGHVAARLVAAGEPAVALARLRAAAARWDAQPSAAVLAAEHIADDVQVDMAFPLAASGVGRAVGTEAARAAELVLRLSPWPAGPPYLAAYRDAFEARYPGGRSVPLLEVLDPDRGIGPPAAYGSYHQAIPAARAARRAQALTDLAHRALRDRVRVVTLGDDDLARLETWSPSAVAAPPSLEVNVFVAAASAAAVDSGDFRLVVGPNVGGSAAGKNLGRFADLLGPPAVAALTASARAEEAGAPGTVWAELVYCPRRFRSANVALRPAVRAWEIAVGVSAAVDPDHVIPLDELALAVVDGRLALRWARTGAPVRVCAGHMLNTQQAPEICRLLTDLGKHAEPQLGAFDWGPASGFPFLPRVEVGRTVLAPARWNVAWAVRAGELEPPARWRERWDVPRHVYLSEGDNRLLLDLDDPDHVDELRRECAGVARGRQVTVEEVLPGFDETWLPGPGGRYACELVVPLLRRPVPPAEPAPARPLDSTVPAAATLRLPGSEWLYAKLYGPPALADDVLVHHVRPFVAEMAARGVVQDWFFLRYSDPDPHLRIRFRGVPGALLGAVLPELSALVASLVADGLCHRLVVDTYEREVARYGGEEGMALAEAVFAVDSRTVLDLLALASHGLDRTALATLGVDNLLSGLGLGGPARAAWYRAHVTGDAGDGAEFRRRKGELRDLLGGGAPEPVSAVFGRAGEALAPLGRGFAARALGETTATIYRSLVHLHCNRLLGTDRGDERLVLGLARRTCQSLQAHPGR